MDLEDAVKSSLGRSTFTLRANGLIQGPINHPYQMQILQKAEEELKKAGSGIELMQTGGPKKRRLDMFQDATSFFAVSKYYNEKKRSEVGNYGRYF